MKSIFLNPKYLTENPSELDHALVITPLEGNDDMTVHISLNGVISYFTTRKPLIQEYELAEDKRRLYDLTYDHTLRPSIIRKLLLRIDWNWKTGDFVPSRLIIGQCGMVVLDIELMPHATYPNIRMYILFMKDNHSVQMCCHKYHALYVKIVFYYC